MRNFRPSKKGWEQLAKDIVATEGVDRMKRVADACNDEAGITDGYRVSNEGSEPLTPRDFHATVITATAEAIADNNKHNRLLGNFFRAQ